MSSVRSPCFGSSKLIKLKFALILSATGGLKMARRKMKIKIAKSKRGSFTRW
jgi:hypothetical protein